MAEKAYNVVVGSNKEKSATAREKE